MKLVFSSVFEEDFAELVTLFSVEGGERLGSRFESEIIRLTQLLLKHPHLGRERRDLKPTGIRSFQIRGFRNYLLFYQVKGNDLILLRLRYGGMDLPALFT